MANKTFTGFDHLPTGAVGGTLLSSGCITAYGSYVAVTDIGGRRRIELKDGDVSYISIPTNTTSSRLTVGALIRRNTSTVTTFVHDHHVLFRFDRGPYRQCYVKFYNESGHLAVYNGNNTLLGVCTFPIGVDVDVYVELEVLFSPTAGEIYIDINGSNELTLTGVDTVHNSVATNDADMFMMRAQGGDTSQINYYTDIYLNDSTGTVNTGRIGPQRAYYLIPESDASVQMTPSAGVNNYAMVDEIGPDEDTTYVSSDTIGHKDRYGLPNLPAEVTTIASVRAFTRARLETTGTRSIRVVTSDGVSETQGPQEFLSTSYETKDFVNEFSSGTTQWTPTTINSMEAGLVLN